jgi:soluble lytic murein transglycosylase-like protein
MRKACGAALLVLLVAVGLGVQPAPTSGDSRQAQLSLPTGPGADWRQWDSFLTNVVKKLAADLGDTQRDQLRDLFLDSRYQLVQVVSSGISDPVPTLFLDTWSRLSPMLKQSVSALSPDLASRYTAFISTLDGAASLSGLGQRFGLLQVSPDMLRGASALLGTGATDPLAYVLDVDAELRSFLGFSEDLPVPRVSPALGQAPPPALGSGSAPGAPRGRWAWLVPPAFAAEDEFDRLNQWVPRPPELNDYLVQVRKLLTQASAGALDKSKLAPQYRPLFRQIVFSAAWQESCWRQFVRKGEKLAPLASSTGDLGMMQVNRNTWRGLYDLNGLSGDIEYNSRAGAEILLYYLSRVAIVKKEDRQPGGNLARATYSAYNGGPRQVGRYRLASTAPGLKKVDEAFWKKFRAVSAGQELAVKSCYGG